MTIGGGVCEVVVSVSMSCCDITCWQLCEVTIWLFGDYPRKIVTSRQRPIVTLWSSMWHQSDVNVRFLWLFLIHFVVSHSDTFWCHSGTNFWKCDNFASGRRSHFARTHCFGWFFFLSFFDSQDSDCALGQALRFCQNLDEAGWCLFYSFFLL